MSSLRTIPIDIAAGRISHYLQTHNYDDCALYINRLPSSIFRKILIRDLSIDNLLSQLPFSIEVFQVIYSKTFIANPETFPSRILKIDFFLSRMISLFASTSASKTANTTVNRYDISMDDERLITYLISILRIISYVQPVLFKRILQQREILDRCIRYFEQRPSTTIHQFQTEKSSSNPLLTSPSFEDHVRQELESTISACQHALHRLDHKSNVSLMQKQTRKSSRSSFDDIQDHLIRHQSVLNLIEPSLSKTKLATVLDHLDSQISSEKEILLAYSNIKTHEKQLPIDEPLLPLFKRFAFAYERLIQLWRRVTDSTLIDECIEETVVEQTTRKPNQRISFERARSHEPRSSFHQHDIDAQFYNDDMLMKPARITPLNPLVGSGRDQQRTRSINNGPLTATHPTQLPSAGSLQSLTSANLQTSTDAVNQSVSVQTIDEEKEKLRNDLLQMKNELQKSKELILRLQKSEEQMRERLAEQAQRQLEKGGKFEDLNQVSRPTELIRSFNTLYSQARIDALDALDTLREMSNAEDLKSKLLFSVVVLAFRHSQIHARDIRLKVKQILQLTNDKTSIVLEETIEKYLRSTIQKYDVSKIAIEVENQLWMTLYDYPSLKSCNELLKYINNACRTAWGLVNQTPPYMIEFQTIKYDKQIHERFHTSDNDSDTIIEYIWPCLIDGRDRTCVAKGVVITDQRLVT